MRTIRSAPVLFITLAFSGQALWAGNPALWLKFDETSGVTAADSSGNGNRGTFLESTPSLTQPVWTAVPGVSNNSVTLPIGPGSQFYRLHK